jgi:hypothetical protein
MPLAASSSGCRLSKSFKWFHLEKLCVRYGPACAACWMTKSVTLTSSPPPSQQLLRMDHTCNRRLTLRQVWSSVHGSLGDEDGDSDVFASFMHVLRFRLDPRAAPRLADACAVPPARESAPPARGHDVGAGRPRRAPLCRLGACRDMLAAGWPAGGAACRGGPPPCY